MKIFLDTSHSLNFIKKK
ncbi:MAG: CRISPR-associated DxTHG motif protein [Mangrovibacterium sp.]